MKKFLAAIITISISINHCLIVFFLFSIKLLLFLGQLLYSDRNDLFSFSSWRGSASGREYILWQNTDWPYVEHWQQSKPEQESCAYVSGQLRFWALSKREISLNWFRNLKEGFFLVECWGSFVSELLVFGAFRIIRIIVMVPIVGGTFWFFIFTKTIIVQILIWVFTSKKVWIVNIIIIVKILIWVIVWRRWGRRWMTCK